MVDDADLFRHDDNEEMVQEFLHATDLLHEVQNTEGHDKCPNMLRVPVACTWCAKHYGDKYFVWRLLMVLNAPML